MWDSCWGWGWGCSLHSPRLGLPLETTSAAVLSCPSTLTERRGRAGWAGCTVNSRVAHWHRMHLGTYLQPLSDRWSKVVFVPPVSRLCTEANIKPMTSVQGLHLTTGWQVLKNTSVPRFNMTMELLRSGTSFLESGHLGTLRSAFSRSDASPGSKNRQRVGSRALDPPTCHM